MLSPEQWCLWLYIVLGALACMGLSMFLLGFGLCRRALDDTERQHHHFRDAPVPVDFHFVAVSDGAPA